MATGLTERVQEIAEARDVPESEILEQALERGVEDLWIDLILSRYVNDEIDRETAIRLVGRDRVKRTERELQAVKYRGGKPRGFTVLTARSETGRAVAGEFNSPRTSHDESSGINTRTLGASVRVGRSTTARQLPSHHAKDAGFERSRIPRNCQQLLRIKVFNPSRNCTLQYGGIHHIAYAIHPRGQAPRHSRCISVEDDVQWGLSA